MGRRKRRRWGKQAATKEAEGGGAEKARSEGRKSIMKQVT